MKTTKTQHNIKRNNKTTMKTPPQQQQQHTHTHETSEQQ